MSIKPASPFQNTSTAFPSGQGLIDTLKQDTQLAHLYSLSAGVGEGYTVEQHTRMVVDSFLCEFAGRPEIDSILENAQLTNEEFALFLALHDIGKGEAVKEIRHASPQRKEKELLYTQHEVARHCTSQREHVQKVYQQLLADDSIGDYLKGSSTKETAASAIRQSAALSGLSDVQFLELKALFHQIDAASYPYLRQRFFKFDPNERVQIGHERVQKYIGYSDSNAAKISALQATLEPPSHSKNSTFEQILAQEALVKALKNTPDYASAKQKLREMRQAHLPFRTYLAWKAGSYEISDSPLLQKFSKDKKTDRVQFKAELLSEAAPFADNLDLLSKITFLHGANSAALVMMSLADNPHLQCTGALLSQGIAPMCGELRLGISRTGVNQKCVSVETIRGIDKVRGYSSPLTTFDPTEFSYFCNPWIELFPKSPEQFNGLVGALNAWKAKNPEEFATYFPIGKAKTGSFLNLLQNQAAAFMEFLSANSAHVSQNAPQIQKFLAIMTPISNLIAQLENGQDLLEIPGVIPDSSDRWNTLQTLMTKPYSPYIPRGRWNEASLRLTQMKQWDLKAFEDFITPIRREWLDAIDQVKTDVESRLLELIDLCSSSTPIAPPSQELLSCFTIQDVKNELSCILDGNSSWDASLSCIANCKTDQEREELRSHFEDTLRAIRASHQSLSSAINSDPIISIPEDATTRELITHPVPVIFGSTHIQPRPSGPPIKPYEYVLDAPAPLGAHGVDLLFTDSAASKAQIERILPPQLKKEITIHLFDKLHAGNVPLIHSPLQIQQPEGK
ncbi:MAG: hypothetical protein JSS61_01840 [Verrucomicrobia bacterium]|nr:hypothetical protein [Verrucomicrobiota bacterium]